VSSTGNPANVAAVLVTMEKVPLKTDPLWMDPEFEGYKLSLEALPVRSGPLQRPVPVKVPSDEQVRTADSSDSMNRSNVQLSVSVFLPPRRALREEQSPGDGPL
jgi:hypothetical protein